MEKFKKIMSMLSFSFAGALLAVFLYARLTNDNQKLARYSQVTPVHLTGNISAPVQQSQLPDLTQAAEKSVHAVVHIEVKVEEQTGESIENPLYQFFYGPNGPGGGAPRGNKAQPQYSTASGSGVIISPDGYIVTNSHVVDDALTVQVILNDSHKYTAKVIGRDPNTDIALVKIDANDLPFLTWGNSDALKLGEWVLAVGNPFNLTSTVTAGIVSAKSRSIGIVSGKMPLESFIQTDAAVNPGNSGGALVNGYGELVGINTAIASQTGSYTGYSFAIPTSIARKVVDDIRKYGEVQRALLGVMMQTVTDSIARAERLDKIEGAYVKSTTEDGAARKAGLREGDIIVSVEGIRIATSSQLQEQIGKYSPGNEITLGYIRKGELKEVKVTLRNVKGDTSIVKEPVSLLGAEFGPISSKDKERLNLEEGVQVLSLSKGKLRDAGMKVGFIITNVNKVSVSSEEDIEREFMKTGDKKPVLIEGLFPNGEYGYYILEPKE